MTSTLVNSQTEVLHYTALLIEALKQNYVEYSIPGHQRAIENLNYTYGTTDSVQSKYHQSKIDELRNGICPIDYTIETGRKYHKIVFIDGGGQKSVHCFIDKETGSVLKSASWKSPAKGERYNLMNDTSRENLYQRADWSASYLYAR